MNENQKKLLNVTDLTSYLYCPRKFYLEKIKGIKQPPTKQMIKGRIKHEILEDFSNKELLLVQDFSELLLKEKIISFYKIFLAQIINSNFEKNNNLMQKFSIIPENLHPEIIKLVDKEIKLRAEAIQDTMKKGFFGERLWNNLKPKYISEMPLISEKLGLKGRVDRVMVFDETIVPFELKTREAEKLWPSDEIQLTAYSMLLEEKYNQPISLAILEAGNKKHELLITPKMKQKVLELIKEIKEILNNPNLKFPSNFSKCQKCFFTEECDKI